MNQKRAKELRKKVGGYDAIQGGKQYARVTGTGQIFVLGNMYRLYKNSKKNLHVHN